MRGKIKLKFNFKTFTKMKNYLEQTKENVINYLQENNIFVTPENKDDLEQTLYDDLFVNDSVTGNASGSYTYNSEKAKEYVLNDIETVKDALKEFCVDSETIGEKFLNEDWEYLDVTARCYVLSEAINNALNKEEK